MLSLIIVQILQLICSVQLHKIILTKLDFVWLYSYKECRTKANDIISGLTFISLSKRNVCSCKLYISLYGSLLLVGLSV